MERGDRASTRGLRPVRVVGMGWTGSDCAFGGIGASVIDVSNLTPSFQGGGDGAWNRS